MHPSSQMTLHSRILKLVEYVMLNGIFHRIHSKMMSSVGPHFFYKLIILIINYVSSNNIAASVLTANQYKTNIKYSRGKTRIPKHSVTLFWL